MQAPALKEVTDNMNVCTDPKPTSRHDCEAARKHLGRCSFRCAETKWGGGTTCECENTAAWDAAIKCKDPAGLTPRAPGACKDDKLQDIGWYTHKRAQKDIFLANLAVLQK